MRRFVLPLVVNHFGGVAVRDVQFDFKRSLYGVYNLQLNGIGTVVVFVIVAVVLLFAAHRHAVFLDVLRNFRAQGGWNARIKQGEALSAVCSNVVITVFFFRRLINEARLNQLVYRNGAVHVAEPGIATCAHFDNGIARNRHVHRFENVQQNQFIDCRFVGKLHFAPPWDLYYITHFKKNKEIYRSILFLILCFERIVNLAVIFG